MTKIKPHLLSPEERDFLSNGCQSQKAPKWVQKLTPQFVFRRSCDIHDCYYYIGNTKADKKNCDDFFYNEMRAEIKKKAWFRKPLLHLAAFIYYRLVVKYGNSSFHFAETPRTYENLQHGMLFVCRIEKLEELRKAYMERMSKLRQYPAN